MLVNKDNIIDALPELSPCKFNLPKDTGVQTMNLKKSHLDPNTVTHTV